MSVIPNQSWINSGTADYITRTEVINFLQDLSGLDLSGQLFYKPNALFSTIQMNPASGSITGGQYYTATSALGVSSVLMTYNRMFPVNSDPYTLGIRDDIGGVNYSPLVAGQFWAKPQIYTTQPTCVVAPASLNYVTSLTDPTLQKMIIGYNTPESNVGLFNISSINGQPPNTAGTTFTTLTGTTLNATNVNTTNLANVTNFNGLTKWPPYSAGYNIAGISGLNDNTPTVVGTITVPFNLPTGALCSVSVPVRIGAFAPGSPATVNFELGLRVGGSAAGGSGISYTTPFTINTNLTSGFATVSISGLFKTPTVSTTNTIEIIAVVQQGVSITCNITNPVSPANIYCISVLT